MKKMKTMRIPYPDPVALGNVVQNSGYYCYYYYRCYYCSNYYFTADTTYTTDLSTATTVFTAELSTATLTAATVIFTAFIYYYFYKKHKISLSSTSSGFQVVQETRSKRTGTLVE